MGWVPKIKGNVKWIFWAILVAAVSIVGGAALFYAIFPDLFDTTGSYIISTGKSAGIDIVAESIDVGIVSVVVLYGNFHLYVVGISFTVDDIVMDHLSVLVQEAYILFQTAFKTEVIMPVFFLFFAFIGKDDTNTLIQKCKLTKPVSERLMVIYGRFGKDRRVCLESDLGTMLIGRTCTDLF